MCEGGTVLVPLEGSTVPNALYLMRGPSSWTCTPGSWLMTSADTSDFSDRGSWSIEMAARPRETCLQYLAAASNRLAMSDAELVVKVNYPREAMKPLQGARTDALRGLVETHGVDLVVMATHGRAGVQRAVLGSTADRMLGRRAPVLLIRPDEPAAS